MACNLPLPAYQDRNGGPVHIGRWSGTDSMLSMEVPCGRCTGCRLDRRLEWTVRCTHEQQLYAGNTFITLSYADEHLPSSLSLEYRDVQLWLKRLRKEVRGNTKGPNGKYPIRFFLSGEYGPQTQRPHWHAILFNCVFEDQIRLLNGQYVSEQAERIWSKGNVRLDNVNPATIAYVAGYTQDKLYGRQAYEDVVNISTGEVSERRAPFVSMSRRPGIGAAWLDRFSSDLFGTSEKPHDFAVLQGSKRKVPGYYWRRFSENGDPFVVEAIHEARKERAAEIDLSEKTLERRAVKEEVALRRLRTFSPRGAL